MSLEHIGVHGGDDVMQEVRLGAEQLLGGLPHHGLGLLRVLGGDPVPGLGLAPVQEVDTRRPVILDMPAEGGETHSHVEPGHLHPGDVHVNVLQDRVGHNWQVIEIPLRLGVCPVSLTEVLGAKSWEA